MTFESGLMIPLLPITHPRNLEMTSWRGCAELAAPLTAPGSPTARFAWGPDSGPGAAACQQQASFDALPVQFKMALASAPVLRTFDPIRRGAGDGR